MAKASPLSLVEPFFPERLGRLFRIERSSLLRSAAFERVCYFFSPLRYPHSGMLFLFFYCASLGRFTTQVRRSRFLSPAECFSKRSAHYRVQFWCCVLSFARFFPLKAGTRCLGMNRERFRYLSPSFFGERTSFFRNFAKVLNFFLE